MPSSDVVRFRAPPEMVRQLTAEAHDRETDVSELLRLAVREFLQRRGHRPIEGGRSLPAVDLTLRSLAHAPGNAGSWSEPLPYWRILQILNAGFVGRQRSRGRGRLDYCLRREFVYARDGGYRVSFAGIHAELCNASCADHVRWRAQLQSQSSLLEERAGGESYGSERSSAREPAEDRTTADRRPFAGAAAEGRHPGDPDREDLPPR